MLMHYADEQFQVCAMPDEVSTCIHMGLRRNKLGFYTTSTWSIAKRFERYADSYCSSLLRGWKPRSNEAKRVKLADAPPGMTYMPHQLEGIAFWMSHKRTLIADEQRVGKSCQAIGGCESLRQNAGFKRFLIVSPTVGGLMLPTWRREVSKWAQQEAVILSGKQSVDQSFNGYYIVNYEMLSKLAPSLLTWLNGAQSAMVIDEAHLIKNPEAQRTKACKRLLDASDRAVFLTGTPAPNSLKESFHLFNLICEQTFDSWVTHIDSLQRYAHQFMIRRTRCEVFKHMPKRVRKFVMLSRKGMETEVQQELGAFHRESARPLLKFDDFSRARREMARKKLPVMLPLILSYVQAARRDGRRVVVAAYHQEVVEAITVALRASGLRAEQYYGKQTAKQKQKAFDTFQNGGADALVVSYRSAGLGLTIDSAEDMLVTELDFVPANVEQLESRIFLDNSLRKRKALKLFVTYFLVEGSYDDWQMQVLLDKQADTSRVLQQTTL